VEGDQLLAGQVGHFCPQLLLQRRQLFRHLVGVGLVFVHVRRILGGQPDGDVLGHLTRQGGAEPVMGVVFFVVTLVVVVTVVVPFFGRMQRHILGGVPVVSTGQHVIQKRFQAGTVDDQQVGGLDHLHIRHGQGVVVETGDLLVYHQIHRHIGHILGHRLGHEIDRIGGAGHD